MSKKGLGFPLAAHPIDDRVARLPEADEIGDQLGRVLQIAIELNRRLAPRMDVARPNGPLKAEVARKTQDAYSSVVTRQRSETREGAVGAAIVCEDKLPLVAMA